MTTSSSLDPIRLPLEFALKPGVVGKMRGLHQTLKVAAARVQAQLGEIDRARLAAVVEALDGFDALDEAGRLAAVQRAHRALTSVTTPPAPVVDTPPPPRAQTSRPPQPVVEKPAPRPRPAKKAAPEVPVVKDPLAEPVLHLSGVGPKLAETLGERGIHSIADLLRTMPRAYEDRTTIRPIASLDVGERALVRGEVLSVSPSGWGGQRRLEVRISDGTGALRLTYFKFNANLMTKRFPIGQQVLAAGLLSRFGTQMQMVHPEVQAGVDVEDWKSRLMPIYPDLDGVPRPRLRRLIEQALERVQGRIPELLPSEVRASMGLPSMEDALRYIHEPPADADLEKLQFRDTAAHRRLAFEEFFIMQVALGQRRRGQARAAALDISGTVDPDALTADLFPFPPTGAQRRVVAEIARDMMRGEPMARLLQGDVGSGKTAVAAAACLMAVRAGCQAAVVAPTEILAEQHYRNLTRMLSRLGVVTDMVTGSLTNRERVSANARLAQGVTQVVVGTHALLQEGVTFKRLAVSVIDEQHRFGVEQRAALRARGPVVDGVPQVPHLLVMTATPIPRTLALTLYGDLDLSVLDEMPPGRKPVVTHLVTSRTRDRALSAVRAALAQGRQAFVVFPLVEESEKSDLLDATQGAQEMQALFPETRVELLHGRMASLDKERAMARFLRKEVGILVSTTVIEVGVDVPNATIMWIEHAERFGLSQLHQLRGRVGRGQHSAECYLVARGKAGEDGLRRMQIMVETQDGFRIAEEDLAIRGPGDFFGTRQAGAPPFLYANLLRHGSLLEAARREATTLLQRDPELSQPAHQALRYALEERYHHRLSLAASG
ncbi:MAG: ATP-dependent DNA helicase RecG [Myxococcota bacterium]